MKAFGDGHRNFEPWSSAMSRTTPKEIHLSFDIFNVHQPYWTAGLQRYEAQTHDMPATFVTLTTRLPRAQRNE
ncbi:hypothetical protein TNCV_529911 [Trichonephila clavipes]|nr:hypothetical protein TNCV_529911 [Trichonephila clavipes]